MWIKKQVYEDICDRNKFLQSWNETHEKRNNMMLDQIATLKNEINKLSEMKCVKIENTKEKVDSFNEAAKPLMEWMGKNCNPHQTAIVDCMGAQLLSGEIGVPSPLAIKYREEKDGDNV